MAKNLVRNTWNQKTVERHATCQPRILHPVKMPFKNEGKIKTFSINKSRENLSPADMRCEITIGYLSVRGEIMPDGNSYLMEEMKNTTNFNYVGKNKNYFLLNLFKRIGCLKQKILTTLCKVYSISRNKTYN